MPSSRPKRRAGPAHSTADWFTRAAIERIAACACSGAAWVEPVSSAIVSRYLETDAEHGLASQDFEDRVADELFESHYAESLHFYTFAGLIELAASAGYVDLGAWEGLPAFSGALDRFEPREASSSSATDLTLVRDLRDRLREKRYRVSALDHDAFYAFASYLHLTSALRSDEACRGFIKETAEQWSRPSDLSFLVSPRHFAEALTSGSVGGESATAAASGLETLRYFQWLTEILDRVAHDSAFGDKLIRHARWSHHSLRVRWRIGVWGERLGEWEEGVAERPGEGAGALADPLSTLRPAHKDLERLGLAQRAGVPASPEVLVAAPGLTSTERFIAEGRLGAARRQVRAEAARLESRLRGAAPPAWQTLGSDLASACEKLAELGDLDGGAVVLARNVETFVANLGLDNPVTVRVLAVLAQSRGKVETPAAPAATREPRQAMLPYATAPEQAPLKSRAVGKASDT